MSQAWNSSHHGVGCARGSKRRLQAAGGGPLTLANRNSRLRALSPRRSCLGPLGGWEAKGMGAAAGPAGELRGACAATPAAAGRCLQRGGAGLSRSRACAGRETRWGRGASTWAPWRCHGCAAVGEQDGEPDYKQRRQWNRRAEARGAGAAARPPTGHILAWLTGQTLCRHRPKIRGMEELQSPAKQISPSSTARVPAHAANVSQAHEGRQRMK